MNIVEAIRDPKLFRPWFGDDLESWAAWIAIMKATFGLPLEAGELTTFQTLSGRATAPAEPVKLRTLAAYTR